MGIYVYIKMQASKLSKRRGLRRRRRPTITLYAYASDIIKIFLRRTGQDRKITTYVVYVLHDACYDATTRP